jgi:predicted AAA+ superfamily ATPase
MSDPDQLDVLERIASALERLAPPPADPPDLSAAAAFVWRPGDTAQFDRLEATLKVAHIPLGLLVGVDRVRDLLVDNTQRFAAGFSANNALLWGARGMGKSSLVKAAHALINQNRVPEEKLLLIEILREDIPTLDRLLAILRQSAKRRAVLFCDDLSFEKNDFHYKALKAILDGGIQGRPDNVIVYATSNRRHLMPRDMIENERQSGVHPAEAVAEKVSLSDRFGLWLGFHACDHQQFLAMIRGYCDAYGLRLSDEDLRQEAMAWWRTRGALSGRVAWQFVQDLAGRQRVNLDSAKNPRF